MKPAFDRRLARYRATVERYLKRRLSGQARLRIPPLKGLREPAPDRHFHALPEVFFQESGSNHFDTPGARFALRAGEACLMGSGVPHGEAGYPGADGPFACLVVCLRPGRIAFLQARCDPGEHPSVAFADSFAAARATEAAGFLEQIAAIGELARGRGEALRADGLERAFLGVLEEVLEAAGEPGGPARGPGQLVLLCQDFIGSRLADPGLTARAAAREMGCSVDYLSKRFRRELGANLTTYIMQERMRLARALLEDRSLNVSEVAWRSGFNSLNYFTRRFRQATGVTPRAYRDGGVAQWRTGG